MFFFDTREVIKIVLPKVLQNFRAPNCTCWPRELNEKGFPRNILYRARLKGSFLALRDFFEIFKTQMAPFIFCSFATEWMLKNPKGSAFQFFWRFKTFFQFFSTESAPPSIFLMICDRMDEKSQSVPPGAPIRSNFWVFGYCRREYFLRRMIFLSLRYGTDLGRSRLVVSQKAPTKNGK